MPDFVHLHCHTEYSLLDGAIKVRDLCAQAVDFGLPAAAITDHGNLFGAIDFYTTAKSYGIKPIVGCEVYVAPTHRTRKDARSASEAGYHLVLLAQNRDGYHNLIKLVSQANLDGFYYKPRVDKELLAQWNQGLIALSACLKGEIPAQLMQGKGLEEVKETVAQYTNFFPGRFYLELQANGIPEQEELNAKLLDLAQVCDLPVVATNDCHYLRPDDVQAHDILLCIQTNACVQDSKRMRFQTDKLYYRSPEEMAREFAHCPQALENTCLIADKCDLEIELGRHHFPVYTPPKGRTLEEEFSRLCREGLQNRLENLPYVRDPKPYWDRMQEETEIICSKGFAGYFLIVQDFINWAKSRGIPVGPGRGSAAGSLAAYSLRITNLDPIRYNLLFERFLNVERESLPDIDVDFCYNRREEVIKYVTDKFGKDSVAQITTFGTMKAKAVVRDVGRALGMSFAETDKIAKLIPDELNMTIDKALEQEQELKAKAENDERIAKLIDVSRRLEGLARHASTHAAGIVISDRPMQEYLPLYVGKKGEVVTQYDMKKVEKVGLIKFDFLGLKTLTVLSDTLDLARERHEDLPDLEALPLDDKDTFSLLCKGQTDGVFQLESSGMRRVLTDLQPNCFEDIIALLALYRPGPLESGMVTDFIRRKHGEIEVEYPHPRLEPILKETYGVILYQEQVMRIASELANYSLGDGDILRRAMGKKDPAVMAKQRDKFLAGAQANDLPQDTANYIFNLIEKFAGYGFNKSHSAAYALISYQTAYLKAHYPREFMAALITSEVSNTDKVISHIHACREMGILVLGPDINKSIRPFSVTDQGILFGLSGIKNVGDSAIDALVQEREKNGPFKNLLDLCQRVNLRKVSKRVLESLIKSGAMDCLGCSRAALMAALDRVVAKAQKAHKDKTHGQLSLLSIVPSSAQTAAEGQNGIGITIPDSDIIQWSEEERLRFEKENLGFFLSGHPLLEYRDHLQLLGVTGLKDCADLPRDAEVKTAVLVTSSKEITTRKGNRMAFCQVEDLTGTGEMTLFPEIYAQVKAHLDVDQPLYCTATLTQDRDKSGSEDGPRQVKLLAQSISLLQDIELPEDEPYQVHIPGDRVTSGDWQQLHDILRRHPGKNPVHLVMKFSHGHCRLQLGPNFCILPGSGLEREISTWKHNLNQRGVHVREQSPSPVQVTNH
ncbi:MAG: DNA polymerase III subunit alpha [Desulfovermiculus sp.]|nr:DNA polymerase III subunit alpha [Desulfovermiculus sp.]